MDLKFFTKNTKLGDFLYGLLKSQWILIILAVVCMGFSAVATAGYAYMTGPMLRTVFKAVPVSGVSSLAGSADYIQLASKWLAGVGVGAICLIIICVAIVKSVASFGQSSLTGVIGQRFLHSLRLKMYESLLDEQPFNSQVRNTGKMASLFTVDLPYVEKMFTSGMVFLVRDILTIIILVVLMISLDPLLGITGILAFPAVAYLITKTAKIIKKKRTKIFSQFGDISEGVVEACNGLNVIRVFGAFNVMAKRFKIKSHALKSQVIKVILIKSFSSPLNELLGALALGLTLYFAHERISKGLLTPESFISFFAALFLLYRPVKGAGRAVNIIQSGKAALSRLYLLEENKRQKKTFFDAKKAKFEKLELKNIFARYDDKEDILSSINLKIMANEKIAVVGPSGQGKTTLVNYLSGHLSNVKGDMFLNDKKIQPYELPGLVATVYQEPFLFDDTISMNIQCGRPDATKSEIFTACQAAGVLEFADNLPDGLKTNVGPHGKNLSTGQRQRVCLARALVSSAPVIIMDELTASADGETEKKLEGEMKNIKDRTLVIITHRLSTARWADRTILLENGHITLDGETTYLLEKNERLKSLFGMGANPDKL